MKEMITDNLFDEEAEIMLPRHCGKVGGLAAVCVCCGRAGQAIDDDGCGICNTCLDAPLQATRTPDGLDFPAAFPHLSLTARHR